MTTAIPADLLGSPVGELGERHEEAGEVQIEKKQDQSWVGVAKDKKVLRKYDVEVRNEGGKQTVEIPEEVITKSTPLWDEFVIGKFLDRAPHVAKVHMVLNKIWKYGDLSAKVEVFEVDDTTMRFKVSDAKAREKILKRGMWNIIGVPMVVKKWTPRAEEEEKEDESIPMWIHLTKVPMHMFSWEGLSLLSSPVGFPVKLHPETLACTSFEVAKVFVKVDGSKTLPKEMTFTSKGKEFMVEFHYPWLPSRCKLCDKWGHTEKVCVTKRNGKDKEGSSDIDLKDKLGSNTKEVCNEGGTEKVSIKEVELEVVEAGKEVGNEVAEGWSHVPQNKSGRSQPSTPKHLENEIQISSSKYTVLSTSMEEVGEEREEVKDFVTEEGNIKEDNVVLEEDIIEEDLLERSRGKSKVVGQRGRKKGQKAKAREEIPASKRSSRYYN